MSWERIKSDLSALLLGLCCLSVGLVTPALHAADVSDTTFVEPENSQLELGGQKLVLKNTDSDCLIEISTDEKQLVLPLRLKSPCYWVTKNQSQAPLHYSYSEKGIERVLLVAGQALVWGNEKREYHKLPKTAYCTALLQGVLLKADGAFAVAQPVEAAHCQSMSLDEVNFSSQATSKELYAAIPTSEQELAQSTAKPQEPKQEQSLLDSITGALKSLFD